ncbi:MAG: hypothetical protein IJD70_03165 [Clostridia bacterium]|nr:hypothetical protein [Clostridia bacterium]
MKEYFWQIETSDGKHNIKVIRQLNLRRSIVDPIEIYVDCTQVATLQPSGSKLIPDLEHDFACGNETLKLVVHGKDIDIVHRGMLVGNEREYNPQEKLPLAVSIILMILTLSAIVGIPWLNSIAPIPPGFLFNCLTTIMIVLWTFLTFSNLTSPIRTKLQKIFWSVAFAICAWLMTAAIMFFPYWLLVIIVSITGY